MAINYEFYVTPDATGDGERTYHARVVGYNKVSTDQLASEIQHACTLTKADVKAVLAALSDTMASHLGYGDKVYLEGIGYFGVTLKCQKQVSTEEEMKRAGVSFKSVSFRADSELKKKMKQQKVHRSKLRPHSMPLTDEQIDRKLAEYFSTNTVITRRQFQFLCLQTRTTAGRIIRRLVEEGKLKNISIPRNPIYVPVDGMFTPFKPSQTQNVK